MPTISGTVKDTSGNSAERLVFAYRRDSGALAGTALSNATTGAYSITVTDTSEHFVVAFDTNSGDPYWGSTILAAHFNGTNGASATYEKRPAPAQFTGAEQFISTTKSKFGGSSLFLAQRGVHFGPHVGKLGASDFTLELWFNADFSGLGDGSYAPLICKYDNTTSNRSYHLGILASGGSFLPSLLLSTTGASASLNIASTEPIAPNTWCHLAAVRSGTDVKLYVDGVVKASGALSGSLFDAPGASLAINQRVTDTGTSSLFVAPAYVNDVRISMAARYTSSFTSPTQAFLGALSGGTENAVILDRVVPV